MAGATSSRAYNHTPTTTSVITTSGTDSNIVWYQWCDNYTSSAITLSSSVTTSNTSNMIWTNWIQSASGSYSVVYASPQERQWEAAAQEERQRAQKAADDVRRRATARATKLLHLCLTEQQRRQFEQHKCFEVISAGGTVRYLLFHGRSANVYRLDAQGRVVKRFCAHPALMVPDADTLLAQKLMLETDPQAFERLANEHPLDDRGFRLAEALRPAA